jgi:hypothetical protein
MTIQILNIATHPEVRGLKLPKGAQVIMSRHAQERFNTKVAAGTVYSLDRGQVVEVEIDGKRIHKIVLRVATNTRYDLVFALVHKGGAQWLCTTVWPNHINDNHATLKTERLAS